MNWEDYFYYDETSPSCLRWKVEIRSGEHGSRAMCKPGDVAGYLSGMYYNVKLNGNGYRAHRIVWELHNKAIPAGYEIDHENGDSVCNKIGNLRCVTGEVNSRNRKQPATNTSGVTGVSRTTKRGREYWRASWREAGKLRNKCYSIDELGNDEAFNLACNKRADMIKRLNELGAKYTARHGT